MQQPMLGFVWRFIKNYLGMSSFESLSLTRQFINALEDLEFREPTEVQQKCMKPILAGQDVIGVAPTGTGKSAAYLLPLLQTIKYAQGTLCRCLILVPTKELSIQVFEMCTDLAKYTDIRVLPLYGGVGKKDQIEQLEKGVDLIIATPGRFHELYMLGHIPTKKIKHLVLDEADRMMDMGFIPQLRSILEILPVKKQKLLFSATFGERVEELSHEFMEFPLKIEVAPSATTVETVSQVKYQVANQLTKIEFLLHLLEDKSFNRVIIFTKTKEIATQLNKYLIRRQLGEVRTMHGNKGQNARLNAFKDFKEGNVRVLVTTDVAARGVDIPMVSHVINFDVPNFYEDYVHRIGRTGRAKKVGASITFYHQADVYHLNKIEKLIQMEIPEESIPESIVLQPFLEDENKAQLMEIDHQKRLEDPDFKGAFHEKKAPPVAKNKKRFKSRKGR